jgi:hypothetical protein
MGIKESVVAGFMAAGIGLGGVVMAAPASAAPPQGCTTVVGQQVPADVARRICNEFTPERVGGNKKMDPVLFGECMQDQWLARTKHGRILAAAWCGLRALISAN